MDPKVLSCFYKNNGGKNVLIKPYFIRLIRNKIIDPNTKNFLDYGFEFYDEKMDTKVNIPCDDSNWCEFMTFDQGFKFEILTFPFSLKLHNDYFYFLENYEEFQKILKLMIEFRTSTIKKGWAIKYGLEYDNIKYSLLEDLSENELLLWKDPRMHHKYNLDDIKLADLL